MPGRNLVRNDGDLEYYHVYNRGVNKRKIFLDETDYKVFLSLLKRYLSQTLSIDQYGRNYPSYGSGVELLAFCLMPNHFHLLVFQKERGTMSAFMKSLSTSYGMYFNSRYKRKGGLFESKFKASRIMSDSYLDHISRYIHLNPKDYESWGWSSYPYYLGKLQSEWVKPSKIMGLFGSAKKYSQFIADYVEHKQVIDKLKSQLADR